MERLKSKLIVILVAFALIYLAKPSRYVEVRDGKGNYLLLTQATKFDTLKYGFVHSSEHVPATAYFGYKSNKFIHLMTIFDSFGPGLPDMVPGDSFEIKKDSWIIYPKPNNREFRELRFVISPESKQYIKVGKNEVDFYKFMKRGETVVVRTRVTSLSMYLAKKYLTAQLHRRKTK